ncbi:MAG TPA: hypothetical protein PLI09_08885 [Candidatus Hydrogenedentes bacterium]|nr:hypothetical protein [Candidatus Hydrogenedentota bacterium]
MSKFLHWTASLLKNAHLEMRATTGGPHLQYTVKPAKGITCIRIESYGPGDQTAWLQPMFLE